MISLQIFMIPHLSFLATLFQSSPLVPSSGPALAGQTGVAELCVSLEKELFADPPVVPSSSNPPPGVRAALAGLERKEGPWSSALSTGIAMQLSSQ